MKTVKYKGQVFTVPEWAKFIAADAGGAVWAYEKYPDTNFSDEKKFYTRASMSDRLESVGSLDDERYKVKEIK